MWDIRRHGRGGGDRATGFCGLRPEIKLPRDTTTPPRRPPTHRWENFTAVCRRGRRGREWKGNGSARCVSVPLSLSRFFGRFPRRWAQEKRNENVRPNRIIHCPAETGGASRLFGERIHLVRGSSSSSSNSDPLRRRRRAEARPRIIQPWLRLFWILKAQRHDNSHCSTFVAIVVGVLRAIVAACILPGNRSRNWFRASANSRVLAAIQRTTTLENQKWNPDCFLRNDVVIMLADFFGRKPTLETCSNVRKCLMQFDFVKCSNFVTRGC